MRNLRQHFSKSPHWKIIQRALMACGCSIILLTAACSHKKIIRPMIKPPPVTVYNCESTREYIATYKYLSETSKLVGLDQGQTESIAKKVSTGCTGAAKRFIRAFHLLTKVNLGTRISLELAVDLAQREDKYVNAFQEIFKRSYLKEYLDLDIRTSLKLAKSLSLKFKGNVKYSKKDFLKLTKFCISVKGINLSLSHCAKVVGRIIKASGDFNQEISPSFIKAYDFARTEKHLTLSIPKAIELAEMIAVTSPNAFKNFKEAYRFAVDKKGLNATASKAMAFAKKMVAHTVFLPQRAHPHQRVPARIPPKKR